MALSYSSNLFLAVMLVLCSILLLYLWLVTIQINNNKNNNTHSQINGKKKKYSTLDLVQIHKVLSLHVQYFIGHSMHDPSFIAFSANPLISSIMRLGHVFQGGDMSRQHLSCKVESNSRVNTSIRTLQVHPTGPCNPNSRPPNLKKYSKYNLDQFTSITLHGSKVNIQKWSWTNLHFNGNWIKGRLEPNTQPSS